MLTRVSSLLMYIQLNLSDQSTSSLLQNLGEVLSDRSKVLEANNNTGRGHWPRIRHAMTTNMWRKGERMQTKNKVPICIFI